MNYETCLLGFRKFEACNYVVEDDGMSGLLVGVRYSSHRTRNIGVENLDTFVGRARKEEI